MKKILTLLFFLVGLMSAGDAWAQSQTVTVKKCICDASTATSGSASGYTLYYSSNTYANEWTALADLKAGTNFTAYSSPSFEYSGVNIVSQASLSSTWIGISYKTGSNTWYCVVKNCGSNLYNYYTSDAVTGWIWKDCPVTYDPSTKTMSVKVYDNIYEFGAGVETTTGETIYYCPWDYTAKYTSFSSFYNTIKSDVVDYVGGCAPGIYDEHLSCPISDIMDYYEDYLPSTSPRITVAVIGSDGDETLKGQPSQFVVFNNLTLALDEATTTAPSFTEGTSYDVTVTRTLNANQWNSLCLPFSMTADEVTAAKFDKVMKMIGIENNVVNFEDATTIEDGEMYIVKPEAEVTTFSVSGKTCSTPEAKTFGTDWTVTSPMYQTVAPAGSNVLSYNSNKNEDQFYKLGEETEIKGFRWYIASATPGARALTLSLDGVATGINVIDNGQWTIDNCGKFIENGRVVIVKNNRKYSTSGQLIK